MTRETISATDRATWVPTKLIDTEMMETASDDWFADFGYKGEVAITVGRLLVRTTEEASAIVAKIVSYESSAALDSVVLVSDANDCFDFEAANSQLRAIIPGWIRVEQINRGAADPLIVKSKLLAALNRGAKIVNYAGDGSLNQWRSSLLASDDAGETTNENRLPLVIAMTCLNELFSRRAVRQSGRILWSFRLKPNRHGTAPPGLHSIPEISRQWTSKASADLPRQQGSFTHTWRGDGAGQGCGQRRRRSWHVDSVWRSVSEAQVKVIENR